MQNNPNCEIHRSHVTEAVIGGEFVRAVFEVAKNSFDRIFSSCGDLRGGFGNNSGINIFNFNFINAGRIGIGGIAAGVIPGRVFDFNVNIFATETEQNWRENNE